MHSLDSPKNGHPTSLKGTKSLTVPQFSCPMAGWCSPPLAGNCEHSRRINESLSQRCRSLTQRRKEACLLAAHSVCESGRGDSQYCWNKGPLSNLQALPPLKCKSRANPSQSGTRGLQFHPPWFLLALQFLNGLPWGFARRILLLQAGFATGRAINMAPALWQLTSHPPRVQKARLKVNKGTWLGWQRGEWRRCWELEGEGKGCSRRICSSCSPVGFPGSWAGSSPPPVISSLRAPHQCHCSWHLIMQQRWKWTGTKHPNFYFFLLFPRSTMKMGVNWVLWDHQCLFGLG